MMLGAIEGALSYAVVKGVDKLVNGPKVTFSYKEILFAMVVGALMRCFQKAGKTKSQ